MAERRAPDGGVAGCDVNAASSDAASGGTSKVFGYVTLGMDHQAAVLSSLPRTHGLERAELGHFRWQRTHVQRAGRLHQPCFRGERECAAASDRTGSVPDCSDLETIR